MRYLVLSARPKITHEQTRGGERETKTYGLSYFAPDFPGTIRTDGSISFADENLNLFRRILSHVIESLYSSRYFYYLI